MQKRGKVFFRVDGGSTIGLGHIVRCLAVAKMIGQEYECCFFVQHLGSLAAVFSAENFPVVDVEVTTNKAAEAANLAKQASEENAVIVLDGYSFNTGYQQILREFGCKLICIDDIHAFHFVADAVINHAYGITASMYDISNDTKLYLGLDYALLRPAFLSCATSNEKYQWNSRVLVCLGGADPNNDLVQVLDSLGNATTTATPEFEIVIGSAYRYHEQLMSFIEQSQLNANIHRSISERDMATLMRSCATAVCSPSSVAIEYMSAGGLLFLKCIADNQVDFYQHCLSGVAAYSFTDFVRSWNEESGKAMHQKHKALIDGKQQQRILSIFNSL